MIEIIIPGPCVPWKRPESRGRKRFTNSEQRDYQRQVSLLAKSAMRGRDPLRLPVHVRIQVGIPIPRTWPAWKQEMAASGLLAATAKPDGDNLEKTLQDAMNGIVFVDDSQVISCERSKSYSQIPQTLIIVEPIPLVPAQCMTKRRASEYLELGSTGA